MKYKLLALDIDETITTEGASTVPSPVLEMLQKASKEIVITFVTARAINRFKLFLDTLGLPPGYHVIENGAKVLDPQGTVEFDLSIPHDEVQALLDVTREHATEWGLLSDEHWRDDLDTFDVDHTITGLSFTCISEERAQKLTSAVRTLPHKYAWYIGKHWDNPDEWKGVLLFHKNATKGNGMRYIQEKLGIHKDETIAVGDGATDVSMFDSAGLKIAMANAVPEMIEKADYVAPSVREDGIIEVIQKYVISSS